MKYIIKEWNGGISPFTDRGTRGSAKLTKNIDIRKTEDTLSCGQALEDEGLLGISHSSSQSLSPSKSLSPSASESKSQSYSNSFSNSASPSGSGSKSGSTSASPSGSGSPSSSASASLSPSAGLQNIFVDLIRFFVKCTDGNTYGFGNAGNIYRRFSDGYTRNVYKDPDGEIKGAIEKPSSGGKTYLQWATGTSLKQKEIPGASDWSDVTEIADNLTGTDWHTMKQIGGANIICNNSFIAKVGYDDSYTNEALNIVPGNVAKTIVERDGRAIIGTYKTGYPNKGINASIDSEVPLSQVGDDGNLVFANMSDNMPARRFPGGGQVNPGGVCNEVNEVNFFDWDIDSESWNDKQNIGHLSLWGVYGATAGYNGVYSYGRRNKEQPFALNLEYALEVDEIGAVANVDGTTIVSYRDGNDFGVKAVDPDNKATGYYESLEFRPPIKEAEQITNFKYAEIFMEALPTGTSVEFWFKANRSSTWIQASTASGQDKYTHAGGKKATFKIGIECDVFEQKIILNPYGNISPNVLRSIVYFN